MLPDGKVRRSRQVQMTIHSEREREREEPVPVEERGLNLDYFSY